MLPDLKCDRLSEAIRVNHYVEYLHHDNPHGLQRDQAPAPVGERHGGCAFGQYLYAATDDRIEDRSLEYMEFEMVTNGTNRRGHLRSVTKRGPGPMYGAVCRVSMSAALQCGHAGPVVMANGDMREPADE